MSGHLIPELASLSPALIIFDKGGTLIDFHGMWRAWVVEMARRLEVAAGIPMAERLFRAMGFDPCTGRIAPDGQLATKPMAELRVLTLDLLREVGLSLSAAKGVVAATWYAPDPVQDARPLTDLAELFKTLRAEGVRIGVATVDDRAPTEATFATLGIGSLVDALVGGDDGVPLKPAPDMVWAVCRALGVSPAQAVVVGDSVTDMQMGRAAGVSLVIGVLSGVCTREMLAPHADILLDSVAELVTGASD